MSSSEVGYEPGAPFHLEIGDLSAFTPQELSRQLGAFGELERAAFCRE